MKIFFLCLGFVLNAKAGITANEVIITTLKNEIKISTNKGFHLNAEAPATITFNNQEAPAKPSIKTEKLFVFKYESSSREATLKFYVCDNKKTVCEPHEHVVALKAGLIKKDKPRSTYNNNKDINLVSADGRPTLLVFSAPWCPACIRMQTETYSNNKIKSQLSKVNFIKLNSDLVENYELSEKFSIRAIPTVVLLNKNGDEGYRWIDFQEASSFSKSLSSQLAKINQIEAIYKKAQLGDAESAHTLAFKAYNALDFAEAIKWFSLTTGAQDKNFKLAAEVSLAQERADEDEKLVPDYIEALEKAATLSQSNLDQIRWKVDYLEKKKELGSLEPSTKTKTDALTKSIEELINNNALAKKAFEDSTYGNYSGFENEELLWLKGRLFQVLDMKDKKLESDKALVARVSEKKLSTAKPGEILMAIAYLREAGDLSHAEALYEKLIKTYNRSYVYFEKYARFNQKNKNFEKALSLANEALLYPEGNLPQLNLLKIQILKDLNKTTEARDLIEAALKNDLIQHKRFAKTLKKITDLKEEINSIK